MVTVHANSRVSYDHFNMLNMAVLRVIGQKRKLHVPSKISKPDLIDMLLKDKTKYGELTNKHLETMNALLPEAKARKRKRENLINGLHKHSEDSDDDGSTDDSDSSDDSESESDESDESDDYDDDPMNWLVGKAHLTKLRAGDLRNICKRLGLKSEGQPATLISRLLKGYTCKRDGDKKHLVFGCLAADELQRICSKLKVSAQGTPQKVVKRIVDATENN